MTNIDDAKIEILTNLKAKEYVIDASFDESVADNKPDGWIFFRLNIFHKNSSGEATFSGKGVYINTEGTHYFHGGGVSENTLMPKESQPVNEYACPAGGVCEYLENSKGEYYCKKCLKKAVLKTE